MKIDVDVVIVGGGPVGLMLAGELRLAGADPLVLERQPEPRQTPKANGLAGQIVRLLDHRGLLERFSAGSPFVGPVPRFQFGTVPLDFTRLDASPLDVLPLPSRSWNSS
jgi:2-polyprenyl-6-methoxyphenol hydroxylase-like FAD-dependent oxidoreductase